MFPVRGRVFDGVENHVDSKDYHMEGNVFCRFIDENQTEDDFQNTHNQREEKVLFVGQPVEEGIDFLCSFAETKQSPDNAKEQER